MSHRLRRLHARMPLRVRLLAALLALVTVALAGAGVVAAATLRGYLTQRVDDQLRSVVRPWAEHGFAPDGPPRGGNPDQLPSAFVVQTLDATGRPVSDPSSQFLQPQALPKFPHLTLTQVAARDGRAFTVGAVTGSTQWRVVAMPLADGSGSVLVAQSLGDVQGTVARLELLELLIGVAALLGISGVGSLVVRASLRPLHEVEDTAAAIAAGDLTRRVPDRDPRTEVGRLSTALNEMLHQIEAAFRVRAESEERARHSEERMRRFVADASHELRTPLTSIRGFAELYRQGAVPTATDVARAMRRIEDEATRMGLLVDDLLLLARLDQQRPLDRSPVDLLLLVRDAVHDAQVTASAHHVSLRLDDGAGPPIVIGDEARLRQVLANLVGNATSHTPPGTSVTVRLTTESATSGWAVVEVADDGPGLTPADKARVFERFYRADSSRSRQDGGSGLGLAIVAALVAGHGGRVGVDSEPGVGTTFRVALPLCTDAPTRPMVTTGPAG